ncbi:MAG: hypothetical protein L0191_18375 [Acidobacteria bacterium]|nr:hypothetical protein [Acidobacteriota bacterium]
MMDPELIRDLARKAAAHAARAGKVPFVIEAEDLTALKGGRRGFPFPFLGAHVPEGWIKVREYFVDGSGFGAPGEPALTVTQFVERLIVGRGYAITRAGQFQVYVGEYLPAARNGHRRGTAERS